MPPDTIHEIIEARAQAAPSAPAILGLAGEPLAFGPLSEFIRRTVVRLNELGLGREDRVALVLQNGPAAATSFLAISSAAACAPLNPAYTASEFEFYLSDLQPRAVVIQSGVESLARGVADRLGIAVLELKTAQREPAGIFDLVGREVASPSTSGPAQSGDAALVLHTSGTTARPKIVPLTQKNLCSSARSVAEGLQLGPADRCLNVMPLFHIHGLVAAVLASLAAGASVVCTPGFLAPEFLGWLGRLRATWYTAVPTMHQAILARAGSTPGAAAELGLRFVRSCSSPLAPSVMASLESTFKAPVIEAYGMTEASHQMSSNPLPPGKRKPGSVGLPAGPEIAIMGQEDDRLRPAGETGEIVIRGPGVMLGYANNPQANQAAFTNGWFRTGDQGHLDRDGYLFITGRIKEIINRGGEKISPREIDEVFLGHPSVAQAVAFAVPDPELGEAVAVALVLRDRGVTADELRHYAAGKLALFKVPEHVLVVDEIPKGPTGKIQRIGMAARLGLQPAAKPSEADAPVYVEPATQTETDLAAIWQEVLGRKPIGTRERFRNLGGDSMLATVVHLRVEERFGIPVPLVDLYAAATVSEQAALIERLRLNASPAGDKA